MQISGPARTIQQSIEKRRSHIIDALHYRRKGMRKAKLTSLNCALCEKLNQKFFLGEPPF